MKFLVWGIGKNLKEKWNIGFYGFPVKVKKADPGKTQQYLDLMNQWLILKHEGKNIKTYLEKKGYHTIAVYGMSIYGRHVIRELQGTDITIAYGIDQKKMKPYQKIEILQPIGDLPYVEAIINTIIGDHFKIEAALAHITKAPILNLEDVIFESYD